MDSATTNAATAQTGSGRDELEQSVIAGEGATVHSLRSRVCSLETRKLERCARFEEAANERWQFRVGRGTLGGRQRNALEVQLPRTRAGPCTATCRGAADAGARSSPCTL